MSLARANRFLDAGHFSQAQTDHSSLAPRAERTGAVGHCGDAPGMNGDLRIYPQAGYVVAVPSNLDPPAAQQVSAFLDLWLPRSVKPAR